MKRRLTVLLTLALLFSVLPFASGAAPETGYFTDWDLVQQKAAVAMLTDLGLVSGYDDGSFQPERPVNRAEASKVIAGLLAPELTADAVCRFPDAAPASTAGPADTGPSPFRKAPAPGAAGKRSEPDGMGLPKPHTRSCRLPAPCFPG